MGGIEAELSSLLEKYSGEPWYPLLQRQIPQWLNSDIELSCGGAEDRFDNGITEPLPPLAFEALSLFIQCRAPTEPRQLRLCYHNTLTDKELGVLADALRHNDRLVQVSLYGTAVTDPGPLIRALEEDCNTVEHIDIGGTPADAQAITELHWALMLNTQPLRLKAFMPRLKAQPGEAEPLTEIMLDDHHSMRFCDDAGLRILVAALAGVPPHKEPMLPSYSPIVSHNHSLERIVLSCNRITSESVALLSTYLPVDTTLTELDLSHNALGSAGCVALAAALRPPRGNKSLHTLRLDSVEAGDEGGKAFAEIVSEGCQLAELRLASNAMLGCGPAFVRAMHHTTSIQLLDISGNGFSEDHIEMIEEKSMLQRCPAAVRRAVPALYANSLHLTKLDLNPRGDGGGIDDATMKILAQSLCENSRLEVLDLSGNPLSTAGVRCLTGVLKDGGASGLRELILCDVKCGPRTVHESDSGVFPAELICTAIEAHPSITAIRLSRTYLEPKAGQRVLTMLRRVHRLKVVEVEGCAEEAVSPEDIGLISLIVAAHAHPPPLRRLCWEVIEGGLPDGELDMSKQGELSAGDSLCLSRLEGPGAVRVLSRCLAMLPKVKVVNVSGHKELGDLGGEALAELLQQTPQLTGYRMRGCDPPPHVAQLLIDCAHQNLRIGVLDLDENRTLLPVTLEAAALALRFNLAPTSVRTPLLIARGVVPSFDGCMSCLADAGHEMSDVDFKWIVDTLMETGDARVTELDLSGNHLGSVGAEALSHLLRHDASGKLARVSLQNCMINDAGALSLAGVIGGHPALTALDIRSNPVGPEGQDALIAAAELHNNLTGLEVGGDHMQVTDATLRRLQTAMQMNGHLELKDQLKEAVRQGSTLQKMQYSGVGGLLAAAVAAALPLAPQLRTLDLSHGGVDDNAAGHLAKALLKEEVRLERLVLSHNVVGPNGCRLLASGVEVAQALRELYLDYSRMRQKERFTIFLFCFFSQSCGTTELTAGGHLPWWRR
eukprot:Hpha_TRINITY_DN9050_c0_g1::TRINITY_DN9050_c0_g1_i1::g.141851::m.141851